MLARTLVFAAALCGALPAFAQHAHHAPMAGMPTNAAEPREPGQAAFAAIQEIVAILEADPRTDWTKVDIEALRRHLVDMDNVTLRAQVAVEAVDGGARFVVTGEGEVVASIRRMVSAHAAAMDGVGGWRMQAEERPGGVALAVTAARPAEVAKIRGLGFIGVMTRGMHHQEHHLMLARGADPHR
ncbi:hypothetical protein ABEG18_00355 [Alsobacter sp. KACC 23698]|uniref:DUF2380 domain-containing protein n=1 Tax=Alsobacter sp. KACC 23698 TaxID=3149229 RepID=A0AAU7JGK4_9HYPH